MNLYVDDTGSLKGLPDNPRAAGLAAAAGHPCAVHGDAFVGRTVDSDDAFQRLDFTLAEAREARGRLRAWPARRLTPSAPSLPQVDSSAPWIADAQARNARRREHGAKVADMMPEGATRVVDTASARLADEAQDAAQRAVPGKLYTYSQDNEEVVIEAKVPAETKAKDVRCTVKPDSISLSVATLPEGQRDVLSGELFQVRVHVCTCITRARAP